MTAASTRLHALDRMAVSRLNMLHVSLCKIAPSEPSRAGAGTWRRQVQSKAAPRCRRVRVQHESTPIRNGEQWPGRTCRPRLTRCVDGPASRNARQRPRGKRSGPNQAPDGAPGGTDQRREEYDRCGRWTRGRGTQRAGVCETILGSRNNQAERLTAAESRKETKKETVLENARRKETKNTALQVALLRRLQLAPISRSVPDTTLPLCCQTKTQWQTPET
jgi:hypothetical protein